MDRCPIEGNDGKWGNEKKRPLENNANIVIRGLRAFSDFESEFQMSLLNRKLNTDINTVFLMPHEKYTHISSSLLKEVVFLGGKIDDYAPTIVIDRIIEKLNGE